MQTLFRIKQEIGETLEGLGDKMTGLAGLAFPNPEIRENGVIQALLAEAFMDTIRDDEVWRKDKKQPRPRSSKIQGLEDYREKLQK